jgi:glycosyltransferase involved in cell wall biosynthesis
MFYSGKRVVTVHDLTLLDYDTSRGSGIGRWLRGLKRVPFRWIFAWQVRRATHITVGSEYVSDQLRGRFDVAESRVSVIPLAAVAELPAKEEPVVGLSAADEYLLYVGNYYPYKNVGVLLKAFGQLVKLRPQLKLVLAGKPDEFSTRLAEQSVEIGLLGKVLFPGFVSDGQLKWLYANANIFVYPSLSEGFGLQGLEAMTQDLPVVAARASCLPEVYGLAAEYFNPSSAADLAKKLDELLSNPKRLAELRAAGRARVKEYSWRRTAERTLAVYEQVSRK